ncbi:MAG: deoxyribose-phosphate aldolase, partial [Bacteroidetes bacterium]|nr:deoxyribose-phosphate aldolase [Bacteroidota bacterium]
TDRALKDGATEVDMVMHVGRLKQGDSAYVEQDIAQVAGLVREQADQAVLKVILETCMLDADELSLACRIAVNAGADFVKTSTGFAQEGATIEAVQRMRHAVGEHFGVKASGGIRDRTTALAMIEAGANRLGSSSGLTILQT